MCLFWSFCVWSARSLHRTKLRRVISPTLWLWSSFWIWLMISLDYVLIRYVPTARHCQFVGKYYRIYWKKLSSVVQYRLKEQTHSGSIICSTICDRTDCHLGIYVTSPSVWFDLETFGSPFIRTLLVHLDQYSMSTINEITVGYIVPTQTPYTSMIGVGSRVKSPFINNTLAPSSVTWKEAVTTCIQNFIMKHLCYYPWIFHC